MRIGGAAIGFCVVVLASSPVHAEPTATEPESHEDEWNDEPVAPPATTEPVATPPPPAPVPSDVQLSSGDLVRASMAADPELARRWRRGSGLLAGGIPLVIVGSALVVAGGVVGLVNAIDDEFTGAGLGLFLGGLALSGGGGAMIGLGVRDRVAVKRESRRRMQLSLAPKRRGFGLALQLRF